MTMREGEGDKAEIQKQWDADPCGAETVKSEEPESLAFYRAIREHRYKVYGPWMDRALRFSEWRDKDILEIGVGLGSDHFRFASGGNRMTALDLSREHLRQTGLHLSLEGLTHTPVYGDAERMPFPDASFDLVYAFGVIHHTPDTEAAVAEIHRVLRPGGTALVALYHRDSFAFWLGLVLGRGIVHGDLRKGWRRLIAEVEYRKDEDSAVPLVKVYSRRQARKLFSAFASVDIDVFHVASRTATKVGQWLAPRRTPEEVEEMLRPLGWYLIVRARKRG